jgi:4-hydroxybenzoate polyprenyltransferase
MNKPEDKTPLCVDLDDSLLNSDLLFEGFAKALTSNFKAALGFLLRVRVDKAQAKVALAESVSLDIDRIPVNDEVLSFVMEEAKERDVYLVTASPESWAIAVGKRFKIFTDVLATTRDLNLKGANKESLLIDKFGKGGFDYLGDSPADLKVWRSCRNAYVVSRKESLIAQAKAVAHVEQVFGAPLGSFFVYIKALRVHQWIKNILIFVPIVAAHELLSFSHLIFGCAAFLSFSLAASSVYLLNDICDLESDRKHRSKSKRPIAAGSVRIVDGLLGVPILLAAAFLLGLVLPPMFCLVLSAYLVITTSYSFVLKKKAMVDVVVLACLYTVRMVAGAFATAIPVSMWLFSFSMFFFFSLACAKRFGELCSKDQTSGRVPGRGYLYADRDLVGLLGVSSSMTSILVLALYVTAQDTVQLYSVPAALLLLCPLLLLWISKIWLAAYRGELDDDPIVFALRYRGSYLIGVAAGLILYIAK